MSSYKILGRWGKEKTEGNKIQGGKAKGNKIKEIDPRDTQ